MKAENGKAVKIHYKGTLKDGSVFDSSEGRDPLQFVIGAKMVIPGFDNAVNGMEKGETKTVTLPVEEAYGAINADLMKEVPRDQLPKEPEPQVGMQLMMQTPQGAFPVKIAKVADDKVTLDLNHPLAGKELTFEITLEDVMDEMDAPKGGCGSGGCGSGGCGDGGCQGKCSEGGCGSHTKEKEDKGECCKEEHSHGEEKKEESEPTEEAKEA